MSYITRILFLLGIAATIFGVMESMLAFNGTSEPEEVTLTALGQPDGTDNVHLTITDFEYGEGVVFEEKKNGDWNQIWIPLVLPGETWTERPIVANTSAVKNEVDLEQLVQRRSLTGVVTNISKGLGGEKKKQFNMMYPDVNLDEALVFQVDRRFPSLLFTIPLTLVGVVLLLVAAGITFGFFKHKEKPAAEHQMDSGSAWAEESDNSEENINHRPEDRNN
ncbi:hypothetical protein Pan153_44150 [Gimesia panareensis]|uniref:Uncharacterized protein n=1 Tax=Gimesia panareensis TaxID=2527978 RepID=A0A518FTS5_9PLAN|nr:hypothetical protein [Gimesia panareensis]QDV19747.1 hypothetical protein Pan153_44150 [Gimesia panareensis]